MTPIKEGNLEFSFGSTWNKLKYDGDGSFYKTLIDPSIEKTKAVDFLCFGATGPLIMLEAKDFSLGLPDKETFLEKPLDVASKARDTVAGIVGGSYRASGVERTFFQGSRRKLDKPPRVIYFFEDLATPSRRKPQRVAQTKDVLLKQLKRYLRWLTCDVVVVGLNDYKEFIPDLTIRRV